MLPKYIVAYAKGKKECLIFVWKNLQGKLDKMQLVV